MADSGFSGEGEGERAAMAFEEEIHEKSSQITHQNQIGVRVRLIVRSEKKK